MRECAPLFQKACRKPTERLLNQLQEKHNLRILLSIRGHLGHYVTQISFL